MKPSKPSKAGDGANGNPSQSIDSWLARLLVGELQVRLDPLTGEILAADGGTPSPGGEEVPPAAPTKNPS
ncbi:MAG: hypothetical protein E6I06_11925 [Chloroflexi bacterium]|nr:MAG: hypothetical protein E6I06_11925 [Chloroflexota bacterium]